MLQTSKPRVGAFSGSGKVPVLIDADARIWESLAILEYLAEKFPVAKLWPQSPPARAYSRAIAAEMHAGFAPLRRHLPMNIRRPVVRRELDPRVHAQVRRIEAIWTDCRTKFEADGDFLFGGFGAADAMYAPIVSRFHTYDVPVGQLCRTYMAAVMTLPAWNEWCAAARTETWILPEDEVDWPVVSGL